MKPYSDKPEPPVYYPVLLDLRGKACLVVGGGTVARRKVEGLYEAGASVTVVAPEIAGMPPGVYLIRRAFVPDDLEGMTLAIAATDARQVNDLVCREAGARGIPVNSVDDPDSGSFIVPAVIRHGSLCVAVSTGGASPTLARDVKALLAAQLDAAYGDLADLLWRLRREWEPEAIRAGVPPEARSEAWRAIARLPLLERLRAGDRQDAEELARAVLDHAMKTR